MELKLAAFQAQQLNSACSNRTFMELKQDILWYDREKRAVLIVPLWN